MNAEFYAIMAKALKEREARLMELAARAPATWGPVEAAWLITHICETLEESPLFRPDQRRIFRDELENNLQPIPF